MIIPRAMQPVLQRLTREHPVVALTGPRQAGKTTLAVWFWREPRGRGVDFIVEVGTTAVPVEAKSGRTIAPDFFAPPARWCGLAGSPHPRGVVVYGGDVTRHRRGLMAVPWTAL